MKFNKIIAFVLVLCMVMPILASCKKEPTPADVWTSATKILAEAKNLSLNAKVELGKYTVDVDYSGSRENGAKSYEIKVGDNTYPIYTDGTKTYYAEKDTKFSVKSAEDNEIMREFMSFSLTNAERLALQKDKMIDALLEKTETEKTLKYKLSGEDFKLMFAPDENITFTEANVKAVVDLDNNLKTLEITTTAKGTEFYGIPLFDADKEPQSLKLAVSNIDFNGSTTPKAPENTDDYPEIPALAQLYPTAIFSTMKDSSKIQTTVEMDMKIAIASIKMKAVSTITTQYIDGYTYSRTISETTIEGFGESQKEDAYYNGKDGYTYYTDSENGNYKEKTDPDDNTEEDIFESLTKDGELIDIFKDTTIAGSTITVNISSETLAKLMESASDTDIDLGMGLGDINAGFKDTTLIINLNKGLIDTVEIDLEIEADADMVEGLESKITMTANVSMKYFSIMNNYVVEAPEDYETYTEMNDEDFIFG